MAHPMEEKTIELLKEQGLDFSPYLYERDNLEQVSKTLFPPVDEEEPPDED